MKARVSGQHRQRRARARSRRERLMRRIRHIARRLRGLWSGAPRRMRRWLGRFRRLPPVTRITVGVLAVVLTWSVINVVYQVIRKPTELFFPVGGTLDKSPAETWAAYSSIFHKHATRVITADLLAALAQVE